MEQNISCYFVIIQEELIKNEKLGDSHLQPDVSQEKDWEVKRFQMGRTATMFVEDELETQY